MAICRSNPVEVVDVVATAHSLNEQVFLFMLVWFGFTQMLKLQKTDINWLAADAPIIVNLQSKLQRAPGILDLLDFSDEQIGEALFLLLSK
jgi:hypothetical protein